VRNLLVLIAVLLIPLFIVGTEPFISWLLRNSLYFLFWSACMMLTGTAALKIASEKRLQGYLLKRKGLDPECLTNAQLKTISALSRIPIFWSGCYRCISYSAGGVVSFIMAFFYFGTGVVPGLYFALLGGPAAALVASLTDLIRSAGNGKNSHFP
jgi:hypothetical protein